MPAEASIESTIRAAHTVGIDRNVAALDPRFFDQFGRVIKAVKSYIQWMTQGPQRVWPGSATVVRFGFAIEGAKELTNFDLVLEMLSIRDERLIPALARARAIVRAKLGREGSEASRS